MFYIFCLLFVLYSFFATSSYFLSPDIFFPSIFLSFPPAPDGGSSISTTSSSSSSSFSSSGNTSGSSGSGGSGEIAASGIVGSVGRGRSVGEESFRVCVVDGMLYNHGDTFSSNYSDAEDEKCEHCFCDVSFFPLLFSYQFYFLNIFSMVFRKVYIFFLILCLHYSKVRNYIIVPFHIFCKHVILESNHRVCNLEHLSTWQRVIYMISVIHLEDYHQAIKFSNLTIKAQTM